ncbi:MAG: hypothetical protein PVI09_21930, partial [Anaerolineae bacterium]
ETLSRCPMRSFFEKQYRASGEGGICFLEAAPQRLLVGTIRLAQNSTGRLPASGRYSWCDSIHYTMEVRVS